MRESVLVASRAWSRLSAAWRWRGGGWVPNAVSVAPTPQALSVLTKV